MAPAFGSAVVALLLALGCSAPGSSGEQLPDGIPTAGGAGAAPMGGTGDAGSAGASTIGSGGQAAAGAPATPGGGGVQASLGGSGEAPLGGAGAAGVAVTGGMPPTAGAGPTPDPGTDGDGDFTVGPKFTSSPDLKLKPGAPAGFSTSFSLTSAQSDVFDGSDFKPPLSFSRQIKVFVPAQYKDGAEAPFMVSSDGFYAGLQTVVQNLADNPNPDRRVPPLVIIGIQNGPNVAPNSERSLEYDTVSDRYWRFVTKEVLPAVLAQGALKAKFPHFKLTSDPNGRGGYGCSSGGPAVMGLAWFGDFNRVFSFSGSFVALQKTPEHPAGAWEYPELIKAAPPRPDLRVFLEVGENDNGSTSSEAGQRNWVIANRNMAAALKAKGNHYRFIFASGAGHCDDAARNQVMPDGLVWLWRGYQSR